MLSLGKSTHHTIDGKRWTLGRLTTRVIDAFRDYIAVEVGDPFADLERFIDRLAPEDAKEMLREAREVRDQLKAFSMESPLARRFLATEKGSAYVVLQMLVPAHPDATIDDALAIIVHIGAERLAETLRKAQGELPAKNAPAAG